MERRGRIVGPLPVFAWKKYGDKKLLDQELNKGLSKCEA
jgi:hypothetical protein